MIDVAAEEGWLTPVLNCTMLLQMLSQGMWNTDSPVLCLPHVTETVAGKLSASKNDRLPTLVSLAQSDFAKAVHTIKKAGGLPHKKAASVAKVCATLPQVSMQISVESAFKNRADISKKVQVNVAVTRNKCRRNANAFCPRFPKVKQEGWYVVCLLCSLVRKTALSPLFR